MVDISFLNTPNRDPPLPAFPPRWWTWSACEYGTSNGSQMGKWRWATTRRSNYAP